MNKTGKKRPLKECLGENSSSNELRHKRRRFDNIVLLRDGTRSHNNEGSLEGRYYADGESASSPPRRILRAGGKRKKPTEVVNDGSSSSSSLVTLNKLTESASNENDIINELAKEFKKARLRPVFFTISSFIEQTVDEVGFTMADEPEVTICLTLPKKNNESSEVGGAIPVADKDDMLEAAVKVTDLASTEATIMMTSNVAEQNINLDEVQEQRKALSKISTLTFSSGVIPVENAVKVPTNL